MTSTDLAILLSVISLVGVLCTAAATIYINISTNNKFKENERIKRENSKELFIHQLQFQTEFDIYKELWTSIIDAGKAMQKLRPSADSRDRNKTDEEIDEERRKETAIHAEKAIDIMYKSKPFYSSEIYDDIDKLTSIVLKEIISTDPKYKKYALNTDPLKYYNDGDEANKNFRILADKICDKIKSNLYTVALTA